MTTFQHLSAFRARVNETFAGIAWPAIALILGVALFDVFRDSLAVMFQATPAQYLRFMWRNWYSTVLIGIPMLLAVMAAINRYPEPGWRQSVAIVVALLVPCAMPSPPETGAIRAASGSAFALLGMPRVECLPYGPSRTDVW